MAEFDRVAEIYDATRSLPEDEMQRALETLAEALDARWTILDAGVGTGRFAAPLRESGFEIVGLDISTKMMSKAREKGVNDLVRAGISELPFRDKMVDATLIVHILHLVKDWKATVREVGRVTRTAVISPVEITETDVISDSYHALRTKLGYPLQRFDGGERKLMEMVEPKKIIPIFDKVEEAEVEEAISAYERRTWTVTWDLPESAHRQIIAQLRKSYGGETLHQRRTMQLVIWEPEELKALSSR